MKKRKVSFHTSSRGLRMFHLHVAGCAVGYCGVCVRVGSRDESPQEHGLAHFVEHTIFKGTERRSSWHIINRMEAVGGELNAYTTKEETVVYSVFPSGQLGRAAELIADLITSSRFPERELEKEREVVADEIDSYLDSPSEAVFDDFEDLMFAGSQLGHNILGNRKSLATFTSEKCRDYLRRWYVPSNMVVFYAGSSAPERVFTVLDNKFAALDGALADVTRPQPPVVAPFDITRPIESHQSHTIVGARIGSITSPRRYAEALFTNILGGPGMNSLLNVTLRERRGLVYSVDATTGLFSDCGALAIYYGCDPSDNSECLNLVKNTIRRVTDGYISPRRLQAAKKQYVGQQIIAAENIENQMLSIARQYLFTGAVVSREEVKEAIDAVSCADIASVAGALCLSSVTLGPSEKVKN